MGRSAAAALMNSINRNSQPPFRHVIEPALVVRESTVFLV
jgi:DNA-binding LacI/PurR family transcriptional regulator